MCRVADDVIGNGTLVMVYMAGANSLTGEVTMDINRMELGLFHASDATQLNLKVVVLADQLKGDEDSIWSGTRLYEIYPESTGLIGSTKIDKAYNSKGAWRTNSEQEEDMGNIETLENFVLWARKTYPYYKHHALILWDHGNGLWSNYCYSPNESTTNRSLCNDEESGEINESIDNILYIAEISEMLEKYYNGENKLDFLGFDACYMGMYEMLYQFRNCAKYIAASPTQEYGGWNYDYLFQKESSLSSGRDFAINVVDGYKQLRETAYNDTMTAFSTANMETLKNAIDDLANSLYLDYIATPTQFRSYDVHSSTTRVRQTKMKNYIDTYAQYFCPNKMPTYLEHFPYYDLGSMTDIFLNKNESVKKEIVFAPAVELSAQTVKNELQKTVIKTWLSNIYGNKYDATPYGISIFKSYSTSYYTKQRLWYTAEYYKNGKGNVWGYGRIEAANITDDNAVNTWKELMEEWYGIK